MADPRNWCLMHYPLRLQQARVEAEPAVADNGEHNNSGPLLHAEDGDGEGRQIALLSQEGSVIAFFAMTRGVVPQTKCFRKHSYGVRLRNHPPHDLDCCLDRAALLTQEGSSANFDTSTVLQ